MRSGLDVGETIVQGVPSRGVVPLLMFRDMVAFMLRGFPVAPSLAAVGLVPEPFPGP